MAARKTTKQTEQKAVERAEPKFNKQQLVRSAKYRDRRDLVDALLDDSKKYTMEQVDKLIDAFMKGRVK